VHKPKETIDFEGREAREAFRLFSRGFADGEAEQREGEQRPGTFLWARLKHREGASVYSRFADASFHGLRKWEEHRFPALAFDAIDWEVVRDG
jgi:hypothetical protein